jgi:hypothetical protein
MVQQHQPQWGDDEALHCDVRATRTLKSSLRAPAEARAFVGDRICPRHDRVATAAAALVASEVVTHAVVNGEGPITIALECRVTTLTLSVTCAMTGPSQAPRLRLADPIADKIVDGICRSSGTLPTEHGLTMWCTIPTGHLPVRHPAPRESRVASAT